MGGWQPAGFFGDGPGVDGVYLGNLGNRVWKFTSSAEGVQHGSNYRKTMRLGVEFRV